MNLLKLMKYLAYLQLISDIADAVKNARRGKPFAVSGEYSVNGQNVAVTVTGVVQ